MNSEKIRALLAGVDLRATTQRVALLKELLEQAHPLSVEKLTQGMGNALDTATVYRTLDTFEEKGLVRKVELAQGRALYEHAGEHHHHIVCTECGVIQDVDVCLPKSVQGTVQRASGFANVNEHALEFFGVCKKCA
ncbi:transcriptional repressor [Patescibacteria group bacterium]|nr:transcriptional repressor [Patescibacteria group bacterium]MBU1500670.1 transcriptional repressor [Patescibacteria group bacterium]MBU2080377.1 transcriptional repressor [Patescibacteria group bacterium]MBU2124211.1 transcriptional repressor [Patescibacteria group bacterium]MBU2194338.1 transcriptional repressor [Patescibacteria group bacterium]